MKTTIRPVYQCDHCKKNYLSKSAGEKHEQFCSDDPENIAKCFGCAFLEHTFLQTESSGDIRSFFCDKLGLGVYPVKVDRKGLPAKYPESFKGQIRMPNECAVFEPDLEESPF